MEVWPPRSQTFRLRFLYVTDSTLKPIVGIVVTTSPIFSLYRRVVLPALSCSHTHLSSASRAAFSGDRVKAAKAAASYQSQDQYPSLLLRPDQRRKPGCKAAH